ncbi:MAG: late competence development ComFB family protein [Treponema sp.]|nr:late competence development ComFB family protein [Treponema sp.]
MAFDEEYDFNQLKNESELVVLQELERQLALEGENLCRCSDCILDMAAMAFNAVRPKYRFSLLGSMYAAQAMEDPEYAASVRNAVATALAKVKANPSHD